MNPHKLAIRAFMRNNYSDEKLAALLAHARDDKLIFSSCCCFIGVATADHALHGDGSAWLDLAFLNSESHLHKARLLDYHSEAEHAYYHLAGRDVYRRRILIPMIRAEMRRRERIREQAEWKQELVEMST